MTAPVLTPYVSRVAARDGLRVAVRAEWTKLCTVRAWVIGFVLAVVFAVYLAVQSTSGGGLRCVGGDCDIHVPIGPTGIAVQDSFFYAHQTLTGDGTITARVALLGGTGFQGQDIPPIPWAKAGILVKDGTTPGSAYAAVLLTGGHGVRMQYDYSHDRAGPASANWLRLARSGDTLTAYSSVDGLQWTLVGTARLPGLPASVQAGLFTTSPAYDEVVKRFPGGQQVRGGPSTVSASFDHVDRRGGFAATGWRAEEVGGRGSGGGLPGSGQLAAGGTSRTAGPFTLVGGGDIGPAVPGSGIERVPVERALVGVFASLIVLLVLGVLFGTSEYRRGLLKLTLAATPGRGRMLAAKALVLGGAAFAVGVVAVGVSLPLSQWLLRHGQNLLLPASLWTQLRVVVGSGLLLALGALLALGVGMLVRRGIGAVALVVAAVVLPYLLSTGAVVPAGAAAWLLRVSPAAAFAIQQTIPRYAQVDADYSATNGYYPLPPWAGLAVLAAYAGLALALATYALRRRDA